MSDSDEPRPTHALPLWLGTLAALFTVSGVWLAFESNQATEHAERLGRLDQQHDSFGWAVHALLTAEEAKRSQGAPSVDDCLDASEQRRRTWTEQLRLASHMVHQVLAWGTDVPPEHRQIGILIDNLELLDARFDQDLTNLERTICRCARDDSPGPDAQTSTDPACARARGLLQAIHCALSHCSATLVCELDVAQRGLFFEREAIEHRTEHWNAPELPKPRGCSRRIDPLCRTRLDFAQLSKARLLEPFYAPCTLWEPY
jgi:hypothetical protein